VAKLERDRLIIVSVLTLIALIFIFFVMVKTSGPSNNMQLKPVQVNHSVTTGSAYITVLNASNITLEPNISLVSLEANYSPCSSLILKVMSVNNISWGYQSDYYTNYNVLVLNSTDPTIKINTNYTMQIDEDMTGYYGMTSGVAPKDIINGTILKVNDYNITNNGYYIKNKVDGNNITVWVGADPNDQNAWNNAWKQKITIIN
jgi:hypothetical protein